MHAALVYIKNDIITGSNNIFLRKVNVKPYVFDKMYMDKDLIEKIRPFYDTNGRTCQILLIYRQIYRQI